MILIVGAGLAGLSAAYHLRGMPYKILEREREVGGLCRSYVKDGFTFDYTGHLLHFRQTAIKAPVSYTHLDVYKRQLFMHGQLSWLVVGTCYLSAFGTLLVGSLVYWRMSSKFAEVV